MSFELKHSTVQARPLLCSGELLRYTFS